MYDIVKYVGRKLFEFQLTYDSEEEWDLCWTDQAVSSEVFSKMKPFQKINHFPGMFTLSRKNHLGRNLMRMLRRFPEDYDFFPTTWLLPAEIPEFKSQFFKRCPQNTFIIKPQASCQGRGIYLVRHYEEVDFDDQCIAQKYLNKPYLIDGLKFDLRLYVLLAGCDPLRIYLFKEGMVRFATEQYFLPNRQNLEDVYMHLTNYAINKDNPKYQCNREKNNFDIGHKRSFTSVLQRLKSDGVDTEKLVKEIKTSIIKTFCSVQPVLAHNYKIGQPENIQNNMCFEILGFDILIDQKAKPWVLEINHSPSFTTDTPFD